MATTYPLTVDSFDTHVDNVDDVMAADVNSLNDAVVALETQTRDKGLMRVKNTSGSTVAANDLGYIDEAGEFKLTTTAYLNVAWAVVVEGAANNSDIIVTNKGLVTVVCNGNAAIGDYLYTSTTQKQAQPQNYVRQEVLGVVKTANTSGAGGTCVTLLLCNRVDRDLVDTNNIIYISSASQSDWTTTINGAPAGAVVTYTAPLGSGAEDAIVPQAATELGKLILHNTTRGDNALIDSVNIGANTITLTDNAPGTWQNGDTITVESQTCSTGGAPYAFDIDLSSADNTAIPALAVSLKFQWTILDTGGTEYAYTHPWEAYAAAKLSRWREPVANITFYGESSVKLIQRRFCIRWTASGAGTATYRLELKGYRIAIP